MKNIEQIRNDNLRRLIKEHGGVNAFSAKIGRSQAQVSQWLNNSVNSETGKPRNISSRSCRFIENSLGMKEGWFDIEHFANIEPISTKGDVPVVSWVAAGTWTPMSDQTVEPLEWLPCPVKHGKGTYALIVRGQSMYNPTGERSFKDGDIIFVDPTLDAQNKDFVIARLDNESEATFKQLIVEDGQKMLMAINPDWKPKFIQINGNASMLGVVIGKVERWR